MIDMTLPSRIGEGRYCHHKSKNPANTSHLQMWFQSSQVPMYLSWPIISTLNFSATPQPQLWKCSSTENGAYFQKPFRYAVPMTKHSYIVGLAASVNEAVNHHANNGQKGHTSSHHKEHWEKTILWGFPQPYMSRKLQQCLKWSTVGKSL